MTNTTPETQVSHDPVNHPKHYTGHPSGIEAIQITEHMGFNLGNAMKYIWRCDLKKDAIEDLKKAVWYIQREIDKREKEAGIIKSGTLKAESIVSQPIVVNVHHPAGGLTEEQIAEAARNELHFRTRGGL